MNQAISFITQSNILISFYSSCYYLFFCLITQTNYSDLRVIFIFLSTYIAYGALRKKDINLFSLNLLLGLINTVIMLYTFSLNEIIITILLSFICLLYTKGLLLKRGLRNIPYLKSIIIPFVWTASIYALLPSQTLSISLLGFSFLFIFIICLPFDFSDADDDRSANIKTIGTLITNKWLRVTLVNFLILLLISVSLEIGLNNVLIFFSGLAIITNLLIQTSKKQIYLNYIFVDGLIALLLLLQLK